MRRDITVGGRVRRVELTKAADRYVVTVDGRTWTVTVSPAGSSTISLILGSDPHGGSSYEVTLAPDQGPGGRMVHIGAAAIPVSLNERRGNSRKDHDGPSTASGPQRLAAAMSGRVVRVLVGAGEPVRAGQGVVVIEAMKMENELRAARDGRVAEVRVREGQTVEAGALLVVIE